MVAQISESEVVTGAPDHVWSLVTEAENFQRWYAFGGAEIELRPGGPMTMRWDEHGTFDAVVESVVPEKLFAFRWLPEPGPRVEITLQSQGDDATLVTIIESGPLEDPEQSALAWRNALILLKELARR